MTVIGWREIIALPDLGIGEIRAKIDTGARTSALHADVMSVTERDGLKWIEFVVPFSNELRSRACSARLADQRRITNTGGVPEERYVIETDVILGRRRWAIEVSLADRANMGFPIILGRTAVRRRALLIAPGRSFQAGPPASAALPAGAPHDRGADDPADN